jgi:cell division protein FtsB
MPQPARLTSSPLLLMVLVIIIVYFSILILQTLNQGRVRHQQLQQLELEVAELRQQRDEVRTELDQKKTEAFIEREARNKLGLARPNETVVVFPDQSAVLAAERQAPPSENQPAFAFSARLGQWLKLFW